MSRSGTEYADDDYKYMLATSGAMLLGLRSV